MWCHDPMSLKSASQHHNFKSLGCFILGEVASRNSKETQSSCSFCTIRGLPRFWVDYLYTCWQCQELMKSVVSSDGSSALLSMMKMIWSDTLWACNSHKAMTALIVGLPTNCCCGDFSATSIDMSQICTPLSPFITGEQKVEISFSYCGILWLSNH